MLSLTLEILHTCKAIKIYIYIPCHIHLFRKEKKINKVEKVESKRCINTYLYATIIAVSEKNCRFIYFFLLLLFFFFFVICNLKKSNNYLITKNNKMVFFILNSFWWKQMWRITVSFVIWFCSHLFSSISPCFIFNCLAYLEQ